jgi:aryl carrier-like protein/pimeloyl-ACP methyl ester carboxylesterase
LRLLLATCLPERGSFTGAARADHRLLERWRAAGHSAQWVSAPSPAALQDATRRAMKEFAPHAVVVSEDPQSAALQAALEAGTAPVMCRLHSPVTLPFGPLAFQVDAQRHALLRQATQLWCYSRFVQRYVATHGELRAHVTGLDCFEAPPFERLGRHDNQWVSFVNASALKGIDIFVEVARRMPQVRFAAVPTWATTERDRALLHGLSNVDVVGPFDDMAELWRQTRVLLVPSLWAEALPLICGEALLAGVPVLAADHSGLPEATLGVGTLLPVQPIERYLSRHDDRNLPVPVVPSQDAEPWVAALRALLDDVDTWEAMARRSHAAAVSHVEALRRVQPEEELLLETISKHTATAMSHSRRSGAVSSTPVPHADPLADLTEEQLLALGALLAAAGDVALGSGAVGQTQQAPPVIQGPLPLSSGQRRTWFLEQLEQPYSARVHLRAWRVEPQQFEQRLQLAIARHDMLRASFSGQGGEVRQTIQEHAAAQVRQADAITPPLIEELVASFDMTRAPLLRAALIGDLLLIAVHDLVADAESMDILCDALCSPPPCTDNTISVSVGYGHAYTVVRGTGAGETNEDGLRYWLDELRDCTPWIELPTWQPRPATRTARGARVTATLPSGRLAWARAHDATPFMALLALWAAVLGEASSQDDLVIAVPVSNRPTEADGVVGFFGNTIPLRLQVRGTIAELLAEVRQRSLRGLAHARIPFDRVVQTLRPQRRRGFAPLVQVAFSLRTGGRAADCTAELALEPGRARWDLALQAVERGERIELALIYCTDLFDETFAGGLLQSLISLNELAERAPQERIDELLAAVRATYPVDAGDPVAARGAAPPEGDSKRLGPTVAKARSGSSRPRTQSPVAPRRRSGRVAGMALPPSLHAEDIVHDCVASMLGVAQVERQTSLLELGLGSLHMLELWSRLCDVLGGRVPLAAVFERPTIAALAGMLAVAPPAMDERAPLDRACIPLRTGGTGTPLFWCANTSELPAMLELAHALGDDRPQYLLDRVWLHEARNDVSVEAMAATAIGALRRVHVHGPLLLGGYCFGSVLAWEMAQQLDDDVEQLIMISPTVRLTRLARAARSAVWYSQDPRRMMADAQRKVRRASGGSAFQQRFDATLDANSRALRQYESKPYHGHVLMVASAAGESTRVWCDLAPQAVVEALGGQPHDELKHPQLAARLGAVLAQPAARR